MKVILQESYMSLGEAGDAINVKPGYARNFLIPQKIAVSATPKNIKIFEDKVKEIEAKKIKERDKATKLFENIHDTELVLEKKVGDDGKLYGSVTAKDIEALFLKKELHVDRRMIVLGQQIKMLGEYDIMVKLVGGKKAKVKFILKGEEKKD